MRQFFHRLSKWFLDLFRKVFYRPASSDFTSNTISEPPQTIMFSQPHVSPKEYGEYLLQSGRWRRNRLQNRLRQS